MSTTLHFTSFQGVHLSSKLPSDPISQSFTIDFGEDNQVAPGDTVQWTYDGDNNVYPMTFLGVTPGGNPYLYIEDEDEEIVAVIDQPEPTGQAVTYSATQFTVPCFLRGTLIATERGEVAVEDLAIGDRVKTHDGSFKPVTWVGKRSYLRLFTPLNRRNAVMPIRIAAGALADGVPARDLHISPKHALLLDGNLIAPELLVNGTTIARMDLERVDYFHVKLEAHDVIFAEGTPAETYVVHGNLKSFNNWQEHEAIFGPVENDPASVDYAPRLRKGEALDQVRQKIAARQAALGHDVAKAG